MDRVIPAETALARLRDGNRRFVEGATTSGPARLAARGPDLATGQRPFAVILGCSDSRVPPEIIFDQGFGDLFVVRVAGNVATREGAESISFAVTRLGVPLIVVLGHSGCGAVGAALEDLENPSAGGPAFLPSIIKQIQADLEATRAEATPADSEPRMRLAIRANVCASMESLHHGSQELSGMVRDGTLRIVGGEYSIESGIVDFIDGPGTSA